MSVCAYKYMHVSVCIYAYMYVGRYVYTYIYMYILFLLPKISQGQLSVSSKKDWNVCIYVDKPIEATAPLYKGLHEAPLRKGFAMGALQSTYREGALKVPVGYTKLL